MNSDHAPLNDGPDAAFSSTGKSVLLVDVNAGTREPRAKMMRKHGVSVHCASSARAARTQLLSGAYNLILVDLGSDSAGAESLVQEIRMKNPKQLVAFLVGSPQWVAKSLQAKRPAPPPAAVPVQKAALTAVPAFDFGQKVRDAEAGETL